MKFFLLTISLSVIFYSCSIQPVTIKKVEQVKVKEFSMKGAKVEVSLVVNNPNAIGFKIYKSDLNVMLNNFELGKAGISNRVKIKRKAETTCTIIIESDFSKLTPASMMSLGQQFASGKLNNPMITVSGELKAVKLFYKKSFPVNVKERISLGR